MKDLREQETRCPRSSRHRSTTAPAAPATFTPSASSRSALPQRLDALRLPCLATRTPHAASTSAATVETLNVSRAVPSGAAGIEHRRERADRAASPAPASSAPARRSRRAARPSSRDPTSRPAICEGWARAVHDRVHRAAASSTVRSTRRRSLSISRGNPHAGSSRKLRRIFRPSPVSTDSGWNCTPWTGHSRCRSPMMTPSSVRAADLEAAGRRVGDHQRVIAPGDERLRDAGEDAAAVVPYRGHLAVHQRPAPAPPRRRTHARSPDARDTRRGSGCRAPKRADDLDADPRRLGPPRTRRNHDAVGRERLDLAEIDLRRCAVDVPARGPTRPGTAPGCR